MTQMIFDGHNDVLSCLAAGRGEASAFGRALPGQIDGQRARKGGLGGGFFALWPRDEHALDATDPGPEATAYDLPLPPEMLQADALKSVKEQIEIFDQLVAQGDLRLCTAAADLDQESGPLAAILHMEGAEAIRPDLGELDWLYDRGLRSLGLVWSRVNRFGTGVPFRFPSDGDIGPGLSEAGRALVARCNEMRILVDLSHLNAAGIRDVAQISTAPLVATHSNAHAVTPHARNLTDAQLRLMAESGGLAGLNFERSFVRPDGRGDSDVPVEWLLAHLDHLLNHLGEEGVALGSDYDGCDPPDWLTRVENLPLLVQAMERHGYDGARIERICWRNWQRVLRDTWGA